MCSLQWNDAANQFSLDFLKARRRNFKLDPCVALFAESYKRFVRIFPRQLALDIVTVMNMKLVVDGINLITTTSAATITVPF